MKVLGDVSNPLSVPERHLRRGGCLCYIYIEKKQSVFSLDFVTLLKLLMLLKEKSMEKPSLIPRAERRKGACNCLHGQHCGGSPEGLPIAYYDIYWFHPQCDCRILTVLVWLYKEMLDRWINSSKEIVNAVLPMPSSVSCTGKAGCPCWPDKKPFELAAPMKARTGCFQKWNVWGK